MRPSLTSCRMTVAVRGTCAVLLCLRTPLGLCGCRLASGHCGFDVGASVGRDSETHLLGSHCATSLTIAHHTCAISDRLRVWLVADGPHVQCLGTHYTRFDGPGESPGAALRRHADRGGGAVRRQ